MGFIAFLVAWSPVVLSWIMSLFVPGSSVV